MRKSSPPTASSNHIAIFQESNIRRVWHNEEWWFSIEDVCAILTGSTDAGAYWRKLKQRLKAVPSPARHLRHWLDSACCGGKSLRKL